MFVRFSFHLLVKVPLWHVFGACMWRWEVIKVLEAMLVSLVGLEGRPVLLF